MLCERLESVAALALDIETINWWNPRAGWVALIQVAYRADDALGVAVIDALARLDLATLRAPSDRIRR